MLELVGRAIDDYLEDAKQRFFRTSTWLSRACVVRGIERPHRCEANRDENARGQDEPDRREPQVVLAARYDERSGDVVGPALARAAARRLNLVDLVFTEHTEPGRLPHPLDFLAGRSEHIDPCRLAEILTWMHQDHRTPARAFHTLPARDHFPSRSSPASHSLVRSRCSST